MAALSWRSQGVATAEILRLCGMSTASGHRDLKADIAGGITELKPLDQDRPHRELTNPRTPLDAYFQPHPPATVAAAAATIAARTGIVRQPTQVRQYVRTWGMQPRHVGMIPAKADVDAHEAVQQKPGAQGRGRWGWPARRRLP
jgi:hypothetical protein